MKYFTGVGSREIDQLYYDKLKHIGKMLSQSGWSVRTGEARGSDRAFRESCNSGDVFCYNPRLIKDQRCDLNIVDVTAFANFLQAMDIAAQHHPTWNRLNDNFKIIMTRNVYQVLGYNLRTPSDMLVCFTNDGRYKSTTKETGGTGQAIRIAIHYNIPVYNIKHDCHVDTINSYALGVI